MEVVEKKRIEPTIDVNNNIFCPTYCQFSNWVSYLICKNHGQRSIVEIGWKQFVLHFGCVKFDGCDSYNYNYNYNSMQQSIKCEHPPHMWNVWRKIHSQ